MNLSDLVIDAQKTLGTQLVLTDILPCFDYQNGKRTENVSAFKYVVVLPEKAFDKISVKILGKKRLELGKTYDNVVFENLEMHVYGFNGSYTISATADDVHVIED